MWEFVEETGASLLSPKFSPAPKLDFFHELIVPPAGAGILHCDVNSAVCPRKPANFNLKHGVKSPSTMFVPTKRKSFPALSTLVQKSERRYLPHIG